MELLDFESITERLRDHIDSARQNWLLGAGISYAAKIPLMIPLTDRVKKIIDDLGVVNDIELYNLVVEDLQNHFHVEHHLSHLGDLIALAERTKIKSITVGGKSFKAEEIAQLYKAIIHAIGITVRYGYVKGDDNTIESIGNLTSPIVEVKHHREFVEALYNNRSNLTSRSKLTFFTTNYDTLLEDALGLEGYTVVDGFSGGSVGYWNPIHEFSDSTHLPNKCHLYKLHGSIDWQKDLNNRLIRIRYGTKYLGSEADIMIYPQATKYVETQKDPFSYLFNGLRIALNSSEDNVLITCGYSFGDDHINAEIENALSAKGNRTTLVAFLEEKPAEGVTVNKTIDDWVNNKAFKNRIYVAGKCGVYYNSLSPIKPKDEKQLDWWTFSGLTNFIRTNEHD